MKHVTRFAAAAVALAMLAIFDGRVAPVVDRVFPLLAAPDAHRRMDQADQFGKIVLEVS